MAESKPYEQSEALLREGKITVDDFNRLVVSDATFRVEEARFERDEAMLKLSAEVVDSHAPPVLKSGLNDDESETPPVTRMSWVAYQDIDSDEEDGEEDDDEFDKDDEDGLRAAGSDPRAVLPEGLPVVRHIGNQSRDKDGVAKTREALATVTEKAEGSAAASPASSPSTPAASPSASQNPRSPASSSKGPSSVDCCDQSPTVRKGRPKSSTAFAGALGKLRHGMRRMSSRTLNMSSSNVSTTSSGSDKTRVAAAGTATTTTTLETVSAPQSRTPGVDSTRSNAAVDRPRRRRRFDRSASRMSEQPFSPADFERVRWTARGGFGTVYLVRKRTDPGAGEVFAMKVMHKSTVLSHGDAGKAKLERDVLRYVKHPFVARLRYAFQTETRLYLVTDFYPGGTLTAMLTATTGRRTCAPAAAAFYAAELALALTHLHTKGIVHRDVKPSNILVDRDGHVALIDFGIAGVIEASKKQSVQAFVGTYCYMAPEMIKKNTLHGTFCDWWALGVVVFGLLAGVTPFEDPDGGMRQTLFNILHKDPVLPEVQQHHKGGCGTKIPAELQNLVAGLLTKSIDDRLGDDHVLAHPAFDSLDLVEIQHRALRPPHRPKLPTYLSFDPVEGRLRCTQPSDDLPKLDDDGESDLDQRSSSSKYGDNYTANANAKKPSSPTKAEQAAAIPQKAFKNFAYEGDSVALLFDPVDPRQSKGAQIAVFGAPPRGARTAARSIKRSTSLKR